MKILLTGANGFVGNRIKNTYEKDIIASPSLRNVSEDDVKRIVEKSGAEAIVHTITLHYTNSRSYSLSTFHFQLSTFNGLHPRHLQHITFEHLQGNFHNRVGLANHLITDGMLPIKPHDIGSYHSHADRQ